MRSATARRSSGSRVRGIADKDSKPCGKTLCFQLGDTESQRKAIHVVSISQCFCVSAAERNSGTDGAVRTTSAPISTIWPSVVPVVGESVRHLGVDPVKIACLHFVGRATCRRAQSSFRLHGSSPQQSGTDARGCASPSALRAPVPSCKFARWDSPPQLPPPRGEDSVGRWRNSTSITSNGPGPDCGPGA